MILYLFLACQTKSTSVERLPESEMAPSAPLQESTMSEEVPLLQNEPVSVPELNATITLLSSRRVLQKTESGKQAVHKGHIRITQGESSEELSFVANQYFTYKGFRIQIEGIVGSLVLTVTKI